MWLTLVTQSPIQYGPRHPPAPPIIHIVGINYLALAQGPGIQRQSYQAGYSKGLEVISQELVKDQPFLCNVQGLNNPGLLS